MNVDLSRRFRRFAREECRGYCPVYERVCTALADDAEVLALVDGARPGVPRPNILLAAARYLALGDAEHGAWGHLVAANACPDDDPWPSFRDLVLGRAARVRELVATRGVQTNEVGRSALLGPALGVAARLAGTPIGLLEIGCSAGLNVHWDRYRAEYPAHGAWGPEDSPVRLRCEVRGAPPPLAPLADVAWRLGVDREPVDVRDDDDALWLRALVWPGQADREARLLAAIALARRDPPPVTRGDALEDLPRLLEEIPRDVTPVVMHSMVLNQLGEVGRGRLMQLLDRAGARRSVWRVGLEQGRHGRPRLHLARHDGAATTACILARTQPHGAWMEWSGPT